MAHTRTATARTAAAGRGVDERGDNELLAAHAAGDTEAFGVFVARYDDFMVRVAARRIGPGHWHDAQDAAADAWIAVMAKAATLGSERVGDTKNWLAAFVGNRATRISADYARRQTVARDPHLLGEVVSTQGYRRPGASVPADVEDHDDPADRQAHDERADELTGRVERALAGLSPLAREVMTRRLYDRGMTARQIAAELGTPLESVKSAEKQGRRQLRGTLADLVGDALPEQDPAGTRGKLGPRQLLLIDQLPTHPTMSGPEAKAVLEAAGLGPLTRQGAYKSLRKARATLAKLHQPATPHGPDTPSRDAAEDAAGYGLEDGPSDPAPIRAKVRAARLVVLTAWLRETPTLSGGAARRAFYEAGMGPIAGRTTRRLLDQARAALAIPDQPETDQSETDQPGPV